MKIMIQVALAVPVLALVTACATTPPPKPPHHAPKPPHHTPKPPHAPKPHAEPQTQLAYDRMMPDRYSCGDDGEIMAKQSINKEQVMLTANLAKLKFNSPSITLHQVASPSGVRYINDANPASTLAWHLAGDQALFTVNWTDGQEYSASCQKL